MGSRFKYFLASIYWFIFRPKTFGVKCVIRNGEEFLMIKNSYGYRNKWMFPGGGINKNETPERAVRREILEEVGILIEDLRKIGEYHSNKEFKRDTVIVFTGKSKNKEVNIDSREIAEVKWFTVDNISGISEYSKNILLMWQSANI